MSPDETKYVHMDHAAGLGPLRPFQALGNSLLSAASSGLTSSPGGGGGGEPALTTTTTVAPVVPRGGDDFRDAMMTGSEPSCRIEDLANRQVNFSSNQLTNAELIEIRRLLDTASSKRNGDGSYNIPDIVPNASTDSDYPEFNASTHAWAIFADDPAKRASDFDRVIGTLIIAFQLFTYWMFAMEAIEDFQHGLVLVKVGHDECMADQYQPAGNDLQCEAESTNVLDACVAFFMLGMFLCGDVIQSFRVINRAPMGAPFFFAILAAVEVAAAFIAACISIGYQLYIGEATDAVEAGVGLLFIRELSQRAYGGIRQGKTKDYHSFFSVLVVLVFVGVALALLLEEKLAPSSKQSNDDWNRS